MVDVALCVGWKVRLETGDGVEFAGAVEGGKGRETADEDHHVGDRDEEPKPVHG